MARIPGAEGFGNSLPQLSRGAPEVSTAGIDAIGRLASVGADVAAQVHKNRQSIETAEAVTEAYKQIETIDFELANDTDYTSHDQRYTDFYKSLDEDYQKRLNPESYRAWKSEIDLYAFRTGLKIKQTALQGDMANQRGRLDNTIAEVSEIAVRGDDQHFAESVTKGLDLIEQSFNSGIISESEKLQMERDFENRLSHAKANHDIIEQPDVALERIRAGEYDALTPSQQVSLEASALKAIALRDKQAQVAAQKRAKVQVENTLLALEEGYTVTDDEFQAALDAAVLSEDVEKVRELEVAKSASLYTGLPASQREELRKSVKGAKDADLQKALDDADEIIQKNVAKDGYDFGVKQGIVEDAPLDLSNLSSMRDVINTRVEQAQYLSDWYGVPVSPLRDAEAKVLAAGLDKMTPLEKTALAQSFGGNVAVWEQLDKNNAGVFAMAGAVGDELVMQSIFRGQELIRDKTTIQPKKTEYLGVFDDYVEAVYGGKDRKYMLEAALAHYAATADDGGVFDDGAFEDSIEAVSGGIGEINGGKIELPRGVSENDFENYIDYLSPDTVEQLGGVWATPNTEAAKIIRDATLQSIGAGEYLVIYNGAALRRKDGKQRFTLRYDPGMAKKDKQKRNNAIADWGRG